MSGPKSSRYTLSAEQLRKILEEQERIRKELEEKAKKERECQEAKAALEDLSKNVVRHIAYVKKTVQDDEYCETAGGTVCALLEQYYAKADQLSAMTSPSHTEHAVLMSERTKAEQLFEEWISLENILVETLKDTHARQLIQEGHHMEDALSISFEKLGLPKEQENSVLTETVNDLYELLDFSISKSLKHELCDAIDQLHLLKDNTAIENCIAIKITPLKKRIAAHMDFCNKYGEAYSLLQNRYMALCMKAGTAPGTFDYSAEGMAAMEQEADEIQADLNHDAAQLYISQSIDAVLQEMGYTVLGKRQMQKKSGKCFTSKLLTYDDGTVVNVTEASTGQITMEIGGLDNRDRAPDVNERVFLRKKMEQFCTDFQEIERRLAERGVVLDSRLGMAPPEELYAQIINLSDYELAEEFQHVNEKQKTVRNAKQYSVKAENHGEI